MWQGLQTITDYNGKHSRELLSDSSLPDNLNNSNARFEASNTETSMRAAAVLDDCVIMLSAADVSKTFKQPLKIPLIILLHPLKHPTIHQNTPPCLKISIQPSKYHSTPQNTPPPLKIAIQPSKYYSTHQNTPQNTLKIPLHPSQYHSKYHSIHPNTPLSVKIPLRPSKYPSIPKERHNNIINNIYPFIIKSFYL
jgi:hypothetical protein